MPTIENAVAFLDHHTIVFRRHLAAPVERVWQAVSTKAELDQWFMVTELELELGGCFSFHAGWDGVVGALAPGKLIQFDASDSSFSRFELEPDGEATLFTLIDRLPEDLEVPRTIDGAPALVYHQPGGPGTHWTGVVAGWHGFVDALECHLAGLPLPQNYDALCESYDSFLKDYWSERQAPSAS